MFTRYIKLAIVMCLLAVFCLCIPHSKGAPGNHEEPFGLWELTWAKWPYIVVSELTINDWHEYGTIALQEDDGDYDVVVNAELEFVGSLHYFTTPGGTPCPESEQDLDILSAAMWTDCLVVETITIDGISKQGAFDELRKHIIIIKNPHEATLVHEVGHWAELGDITPYYNWPHRIMASKFEWFETHCMVHPNCPQNFNEAVAFERGKRRPPL